MAVCKRDDGQVEMGKRWGGVGVSPPCQRSIRETERGHDLQRAGLTMHYARQRPISRGEWRAAVMLRLGFAVVLRTAGTHAGCRPGQARKQPTRRESCVVMRWQLWREA